MIIKIKQVDGLRTALDAKVSGSGTINYIPKWSSTTGLTDSIIRESGTSIGISVAPDATLHVQGSGTGTTNSFIVENSSGTDSLKVQNDGQIILPNVQAAQANLTLGINSGATAKGGIIFNSGNATPSSIYDSADGTYSNGLTLLSRNNIFEFIDGVGGGHAGAIIKTGNISNVRKISGDTARPLVIQGGISYNDVNDGIQFETVNGSNVSMQRFQIEAGSNWARAYFTNIDGVGIGTSAGTAMLDVNGSVRFRNLTTTPAIGHVLQATSTDGDLDWVDINGIGNFLEIQTTNATVGELLVGGSGGTRYPVASNTMKSFVVTVTAIQTAGTGAGSVWSHRYTGVIKNISGTTQLIGTITKETLAEDPGAATWSASVEADAINNALTIDVAGEASKTIEWRAKIEEIENSY